MGLDTDKDSNDMPYGNALFNDAPYRGVNMEVMEKALELRQFVAPSKIIFNEIRNVYKQTRGLKDARQIYNAINYQKQKG